MIKTKILLNLVKLNLFQIITKSIFTICFLTIIFHLKDLGNVNINLGEKNKLKIFKKNNIYNIVGSSLDLSKYLSQKKKKNLKILN